MHVSAKVFQTTKERIVLLRNERERTGIQTYFLLYCIEMIPLLIRFSRLCVIHFLNLFFQECGSFHWKKIENRIVGKKGSGMEWNGKKCNFIVDGERVYLPIKMIFMIGDRS